MFTKTIYFKVTSFPYFSTYNSPTPKVEGSLEEMIIVKKDIIEEIDRKLKNSTNIELSEKDMLYFCPGVSVPRDKFKTYAQSHNISATRDSSKAHKLVTSKNTFNKLFSSNSHYVTTAGVLLQYLKNDPKLDITSISTVITELESYASDTEILYDNYRLNSHMADSRYKTVTTMESTKKHEDLLNNLYSKPIYNEDSIIELINDDSSIIDESMYLSLCDFLNSPDKGNTVLAMEIMANSNYEKSFPYLVLLLYKYQQNIFNSPTKSHVNFKSLLVYMGINNIRWALRIDDCFELLIKSGKVTEENVKIISTEVLKNVSLSYYKHIKASELTLSEEICNILGRPVRYNIDDI